MSRHQMPRRTKRRLIAAITAAVALIGTGVVVGVTGNAFARNRPPASAPAECLPEPGAPPSSVAPPASSAPASSAPADAPPAEEAPAGEAPAEEAPPAEAPAGEAPAEEAPVEEAPAEEGAAKPDENQGTAPAAAVERKRQPGEETGPAPAETVPAPAPADTVQNFTAEECVEPLGPFPQDFINIRNVAPNNLAAPVRTQRGGSRGTFTTRCGTNENGHNNPDNFITSPGVANGAHHLHDYVGNLSADGNSTNESLEAAGTTCRAGDKSTYFWPVIRVRDRSGGGTPDATNPHNVGRVVKPSSVNLTFRGNATARVVPMANFTRLLTGDAKSSINGGANANAKWTCSGFTNRITTKYPLCPRGSRVQRILDFASCWDGVNTDSANHRTHVVFPGRDGACPSGTQPIPQLRMTLSYDLPLGRLFALDAFPEVKHNPLTDHGDFVPVMPAQLMNRVVTCINRGQSC